jgi:hypothetical protein
MPFLFKRGPLDIYNINIKDNINVSKDNFISSLSYLLKFYYFLMIIILEKNKNEIFKISFLSYILPIRKLEEEI